MKKKTPKCQRIKCELWTPGRRGSPSGVSRHMHSTCTLDAPHDGPHVWGEAVEIRGQG